MITVKLKFNQLKHYTLIAISLYSFSFLTANLLANAHKTKLNASDITVTCPFDGGMSEYDGTGNGKIYIANKSGTRALKNLPGSNGKIETIIDTAGGRNLGDLTFIEDNQVYTFHTDKNICLSLKFPGEAKYLVYSSGCGLYCSTQSGFVYYYNYKNATGNWERISDRNIEGQDIIFFSYLPTGLYVVADKSENGIVYRYEKGKWNLTKNQIPSNNTILSTDSKSKIAQTILENDNSYSVDTDTAKSINNSSNGLTGRNLNWAADCSRKNELSVIPQNMKATAQYVSPAYKFPEDAIYRITIQGKGLNEIQLFDLKASKEELKNGYRTGYNGIWYTLRCNGIETSAYPILGYRYIADATTQKACLNPRTISFLWKGPKCEKKGEYSLRIETHVYAITSDQDHNIVKMTPKGLHTTVIPLPQASSWDPRGLTVKSETTPTCYNNGTAAKPFRINIMDTNGHSLNSIDDAYKHLVFYTNGNDQLILPDDIVGCNPYKNSTPEGSHYNTNYMSILPSESVKIDGFVKYGKIADTNEGKIFYLFEGLEGYQENSISVCLANCDGSIDDQRQDFINVSIPDTVQIINNPSNTESNTNEGKTISLIDTSTGEQLEVSNWEGIGDNSSNSGYVNYIQGDPQDLACPDKGIFALAPQGYNTLTLDQRKNWASMQAGYYLNPIITDVYDGLHANLYFINDKASYCNVLKGKTLHAYLFDQYGRYCDYSHTDGDTSSKYWHKNVLIIADNFSNLPICIHTDNKFIKGLSKYGKGIFLPPALNHKNPYNGVYFLTIIPNQFKRYLGLKWVYGYRVFDRIKGENNAECLKDKWDYFKKHPDMTLNFTQPFGIIATSHFYNG